MPTPMTITQALELADNAAPCPAEAHRALQTLRTSMLAMLHTLREVRAVTGLQCSLGELPQHLQGMTRLPIKTPVLPCNGH